MFFGSNQFFVRISLFIILCDVIHLRDHLEKVNYT